MGQPLWKALSPQDPAEVGIPPGDRGTREIPAAPAPPVRPASEPLRPQGLVNRSDQDLQRTPARSIHPSETAHVRKALRRYIGPLADFIVDEQAKKARDIRDLWRRVSAEIDSEDDRREFLRIRPS